nr:WD40 repeat domain-containing protein [Ruegeria arenilitoris]
MKPLLLKGHRNQVWAVAYSQDGRNLVTGDRDGNIRIWDTNTKQIEDQFDLGQAPVWNIAPTASKLFFVATGNGVHRIDASNTSVVQTIGLPDTAINRVTVSPDETRLAAASSDGRIYVWNIAENRLERAIEADDNTLWSVAFSTDSSRIASASSDEVVKVWDLENGEELASYGGLKGGATDIAFLADEATLVATDRSGELHWWDTAVNRRLMPVQKVHAGPSWRIALAPDGQSFATTGEDGLTRIWDSLDLEKACSLGSPAFDKERRNQYLGSEEPTTSCSAIQ